MQNLKSKYNKGFTLAEVLITLLIIGVIASIAIPALLNNINNANNVVQLKKAYATLQQVFGQLKAENGGSIISIYQNDALNGGANVMNTFATKLSVIKNCGLAMGCWYDSPVYYLNKSTWSTAIDTSWNGQHGKAVLNDGTIMRVYVTSANCTDDQGIGPLDTSVCGDITVDVNGNKGPNTIGKDFFRFWVTKTGIYPFGTYNDGYYCNVSPGDSTNSNGCTTKVLSESAMNY